MEVTESDLEPDTASRASLSGSRDTRTTIDVVPERDLLPDEPLDEPRITPTDGAHHPHTMDLEHAAHPRHHHRGGPWLLAAGALLLLAPLVMSARTPPQLGGDPVVAAAAAAPPLAAPPVSSPEVERHPEWEMDLADRFVLAQDDENARAQRELALDPVHVTNDPASSTTKARTTKTPRAPFSAEQALAAIRASGIGSAQCGEGAAGATVVSVTFAPSGRVTRALVEDGPLQGTSVGGCIARQLRNVRVAPFDGDFQTLRTDVTLR
jgi:hypothetical protein